MNTIATPLDTEIEETWIALRRELLVRDGCVARAGAGNTIEVQLRGRSNFARLTLPDGKTFFATAAARDAVLAKLT